MTDSAIFVTYGEWLREIERIKHNQPGWSSIPVVDNTKIVGKFTPYAASRIVPTTDGGFRCPACQSRKGVVTDSRPCEDGFVVRRRRHCSECSFKCTTLEKCNSKDYTPPALAKHNGAK